MPNGKEIFANKSANGLDNVNADYIDVLHDLTVHGDTILAGDLDVDGTITATGGSNVTTNTNTYSGIDTQNTNSGTSAAAVVHVENDTGDDGYFGITSSTNTGPHGIKRTFVEGPGVDVSTTGGASKTVRFMTNNTTRVEVGDTEMTSSVPITIPADPTTDSQVANKNYVDDSIAAASAISSLTGDVTATGPGAAAATIQAIQGNTVSLQNPQVNQTIVWDGTEWVPQDTPITPGQQLIIYSTSTSAGFGGYNVESLTIPTSTQVDTSTAVTSGTSPVLIQGFVTAALGVSTIPAGTWILNTYGYVSAGSTCKIAVDVYSRTSGGTETLLFSNSGSTLLANGSPQLYTETFNQSSFSVATTDRLVVKYYATNSDVTSRDVHFVYEGSQFDSNIVTPLIGYFTALEVQGNAHVSGTITQDSLTASLPVFTNGSKTLVSNSVTGTGSVVMSNTPTLVTPNIGGATADTLAVNNLTASLPVFSNAGKALVSNTMTGTGSVVMSSAPQVSAVRVTDTTASSLVATNATKDLVSVTNGTVGQVLAANLSGAPTFQDIGLVGTSFTTRTTAGIYTLVTTAPLTASAGDTYTYAQNIYTVVTSVSGAFSEV